MDRVKSDNSDIIDATKLSLDKWLTLLGNEESQQELFISYCFPTPAMSEEYLKSIKERTDDEVIGLIRHFLIPSGNLGADDDTFQWLMYNKLHDKRNYDRLMKKEYFKRLDKEYLEARVWEGNTWVLDLLSHWPKLALDALNAYFMAHCQVMPDGRITGLSDAEALIRAKFIQTPRNTLLASLNPYQFEHLTNALYKEMGYLTALTPMSYDGGRDIIAKKSGAAKREMLLIQCKTKRRRVGVEIVRSLLGVVTDEKATKGVVVSLSGFTSEAKKLERRNARLELIDNSDLQVLLNEYLGPTWSNRVDDYILRGMSHDRSAEKHT